MAELEVAKHGKNVIQMVTAKEHGLAHRLREIAIEIAIIVFAVSMSIWLHGLSEHRHQQQEVRTFLLGLKADLASDAEQLRDAGTSYQAFDRNYAYLASLAPRQDPDWQKFESAYTGLSMNRFFIPTKSRYDGFLMSGKLINIEDEQLLSAILDLYQNQLQLVRSSEGGWLARQHKLREFRDDRLEGDDARSRLDLLTSPKGKRLLREMNTSSQLYKRYQQYIDSCNAIVKMIDTLYPGQAAQGAH